MKVIGITGTNGKTTLTYLIEAMFSAAGIPCGVMGTIGYRLGRESRGRPPTPPPRLPTCRRCCGGWPTAAASAVAMEVSSHALEQHRVDGTRFAFAVFTNLSQDHLDYHGDFEAYYQAKRRLFTDFAPGASVINLDDQWGRRLAGECPGETITFGDAPRQHHPDRRVDPRPGRRPGFTRTAGRPAGACLAAGGRPQRPEHRRRRRARVGHGTPAGGGGRRDRPACAWCPGRMEKVSREDEPLVLVDYAHTPDALEKLIAGARPLAAGRLMLVFGCGGDRDRTKRPLMGAIAARGADLAFVTRDNPRSEEPEAIIEAIVEGYRSVRSDGYRGDPGPLPGDSPGDRHGRARRCRPGRRQGARDLPDPGTEGGRLRRPGRGPPGARRDPREERVRYTATEIAAAVGGSLARSGGVATGVSTDSRIIRPGDLFVAISADQKGVRESRTDGHDYVDRAVAAGAAGVMVSAGTKSFPWRPSSSRRPTPCGRWGTWRRTTGGSFAGKVVVVTGSNGKSTTKEMIAAILSVRWRTARNPGNFNNLLGLPLSILGMPDDTEALVLEAGMSRPGEIGRLAEIAVPDVGLITCVAPAHLEALGDVESVARAKGELLDRLGNGTAVLNADDRLVMAQVDRWAGRAVTFGLAGEAWMRAERVVARTDGGCGFDLVVDGERRRMGIAMAGMHNVRNALAAAAAARVLGFSLEEIAQGLAASRPLSMRMEIIDLPSGVRVINDTYNANPGSVAAAVEAVMLMVARGRRAALLGDMLELGPASRDLHAETGRFIAGAGISLLVTVGNEAETASQAYNQTAGARQRSSHYRSIEEAAVFLRKELRQGDLLLVKASRGMGLEKVVPLLGPARGEG